MSREQQFADQLRRRYPEVKFRDASPLLHAMREIKSTAELALIQRAVDITVEAQKAAMARVMTADARKRGAGDDRVHVPEPRRLLLGVPVDCRRRPERDDAALRDQQRSDCARRSAPGRHRRGGRGLRADVTRTYPADGTFSTEQRAIYDAVFAAQSETMPLMRPGRRFIEVHNTALERRRPRAAEARARDEEHAGAGGLYLFHGVGPPARPADARRLRSDAGVRAGDGLHERAGRLRPEGRHSRQRGLQEASAAEQESMRAAVARYDGIGVRIEDDVLITAGEPKVLSAGAPRAAKDIEAVMAAAPSSVSRNRAFLQTLTGKSRAPCTTAPPCRSR